MFKCPYCLSNTTPSRGLLNTFKSWVDVRKHVSSCSKNTKTYMICTYYGPIHIDVLLNYDSIQQFKKDFPKNTFSPSHWYDLRQAGKSNLRSGHTWSKISILNSIKSYYKSYNKVPSSREFHPPVYPSRQTVREYFGSWNKAIKAAGLIPNETNLFGTPTKGKDGVVYRSKAEAFLVDKYLYKRYKYIYEPKYGNGTKWMYDFYLPELNMYIELTAYIDPEVISLKKAYTIENNINCRFIHIDEIYKEGFKIC